MNSKIVVFPFGGPSSEPSAWLEGQFVGDMRYRVFNRWFYRDEELVEGDALDQHYVWRVGEVLRVLEVPEDTDDTEEDRIGRFAYNQMVAEIRRQFPDHEIEFVDREG